MAIGRSFLCSFMLYSLVPLQLTLTHNIDEQEVEKADDGWYKLKKSDLCPNLQKSMFCPADDLINLEDLFKEMDKASKKSGSVPIPDESLKYGKDSAKCSKPVHDALCSSTNPLCLEDKKLEHLEAEKVCKDVYERCPYLAGESSLQQYIKECEAYLKRKYTDMTCESVGSTDYDEGGCPRPTKKVPAFYIPLYERKSKSLKDIRSVLETVNKLASNALSKECLTSIEQLMCIPIYCSDTDDNIVLIQNKKQDCEKAMDCMKNSMDKIPFASYSVLKPATDELKDMVGKTCESVIATFDELVNPSKKTSTKKSIGFNLSPSILLLLSTLCLNLLW